MGAEAAFLAVASRAAAALVAFPVVVTFRVVDFAQLQMRSGARLLLAEASVDWVAHRKSNTEAVECLPSDNTGSLRPPADRRLRMRSGDQQ
jgi:hypothetical protein